MRRKTYPSDKQDQFVVRFPEGMRDALKKVAEANGRSMNAEIIARLEDSLKNNNITLTGEVLDRFQFLSELTNKSLQVVVLQQLQTIMNEQNQSSEIHEGLRTLIPDISDEIETIEFDSSELKNQIKRVHLAYAELIKKLSKELLLERKKNEN